MKAEFILVLERVRADIAEALLAAHRDDTAGVVGALEQGADRMRELVTELRAA